MLIRSKIGTWLQKNSRSVVREPERLNPSSDVLFIGYGQKRILITISPLHEPTLQLS